MTVDWLLVAIIALAIALAATAWIRVDADTGPGSSRPAGVMTLEDAETLLVFEDYNRGPGDWAAGTPHSDVDRFGAIVGPFYTTEPVVRSFELPDGTDRVRIRFDILSPDTDTAPELAVDLSSGTTEIRRSAVLPARDHIFVEVAAPDSPLTLTLTAVDGGVAWALDNLSVTSLTRQ